MDFPDILPLPDTITEPSVDQNILPPPDTIAEPSVDQIHQVLETFHKPNSSRYIEFSSGVFGLVTLRLSCAPRRYPQKTLDYDIVKIVVNGQHRRQGYATRFFKNIMIAAERNGRGVFLEQCITPGSQGLACSLLDKGLVTKWGYEIHENCLNFLSTYPPPKNI